MTLDAMKTAVNAELRRYVETITEPSRAAGRDMYNCPLCPSGTGSNRTGAFHIFEQDGRPLWKCHACGQAGDAVKLYELLNPGTDFKAAVQGLGRHLGFGELDSSNLEKKQRGRIIERREHVYQTADGQTFGRKIIVKYENADSKQRAPRWERFNPETGRWSKGLGGSKAPLYHLPELIHAAQDAPLWIVEGEKDADTMTQLGFIATSAPNGAGARWRDMDTPPFKGRTVYIMGDNDDAGHKYARTVAHALHAVAAAVYVIDPVTIWPELPNKGDISDICAAIGDKAAGAALEEAVKAAEPWEPEPGAEPERPAPAVTWEGEHLNLRNLAIYLEATGRDIRYNVLSRRIEYNGFSDSGTTGHEANDIPVKILNELQGQLKSLTLTNIQRHVAALAHEPSRSFNPVLELIDGAEWDGADHLAALYGIMHIEHDDLSRTFVRKWLLQAYGQLHNTLDAPRPPEFVLTLQGKQNTGKTSLLRMLAMKPEFLAEGAEIDPSDKDTRIQATTVFLAELGEVGRTLRRDQDALKKFLTSPVDEIRAPYMPEASRHPRLTSFAATVNEEQFLRDDTGNRRWAVVHITENMDIPAILTFPALQLWAQIRELYRAEGEDCYRLTRAEGAAQEKRNRAHAVLLPAEQEVADIIQAAQDDPNRYELRAGTVTEWQSYYSQLSRYSAEKIGKALTSQGCAPVMVKVGGRMKRFRTLPFPKAIKRAAEQ